ncbi:uncharacterized protein LOC134272903 [Saccostrea cucullata]|uniref:uncharacterized protein LOC134272903 n=1 Tax=Saccostrea cuccullata TaxID=36930 RepID=UPI002ECFF652
MSNKESFEMAEDKLEESIGTAQHYIGCAICEDCSSFYCNDCHQSLCDQHRDAHLKEEENKQHEVVLYIDRRIRLPVEKCTIHPTRDLEIYCEFCKDPICSKCSTSNHSNHQASDLEIVYNNKFQQCKGDLSKIGEEKLDSHKERTEKDEERFNLTRSAMVQRAEEMKEIVDNVLSEMIIELGAMKDLYSKETEKERSKIKASIEQHKKEMERESMKPSSLLKFHQKLISQALEKEQNPVTDYSAVPIFMKGKEDKKVILQQFGEICWPVKELNSYGHKEAKNLSQTYSPLGKEREAKSRRTNSLCDITGAPSIQFDVKKEGKINICTLAFHLSVLSSGNFWASNSWGDLILFDKEGNVLKKITTNMVDAIGYHNITVEGELLFTLAESKGIFQVTGELTTSRIISCEEWEPGAIYSSLLNGDILVGMNKNKEFKVTRFSKEGTKLQVIQKDEKGNNLYKSITYITENINGDIYTSDYTAHSVVGVNRSGQHRFSYSGHKSQSEFHPNGICTDKLGHILVCNSYCSWFRNFSSVHLLDIDGHFFHFYSHQINVQGNPVLSFWMIMTH